MPGKRDKQKHERHGFAAKNTSLIGEEFDHGICLLLVVAATSVWTRVGHVLHFQTGCAACCSSTATIRISARVL